MPDESGTNPWSISYWLPEPGRQAGSDAGRMAGALAAPELASVLQPPTPVTDPDDYDPADWYAHFAADWPEVENVIPPDQQVLERDRPRVLEWVNASLAQDKQRSYVVCFHMAKYQMYCAGFDVSGPPALDTTSHLVIQEQRLPGGGTEQELQLLQARLAIGYLRDTLASGEPVMIGVKLNYYDAEPNNLYRTPYIVATDHFVVAVGAGAINGKPYINVYDYLHKFRSDVDRLHLTPLMTLDSPRTVMRMIELRKTYKRAGKPG